MSSTASRRMTSGQFSRHTVKRITSKMGGRPCEIVTDENLDFKRHTEHKRVFSIKWTSMTDARTGQH